MISLLAAGATSVPGWEPQPDVWLLIGLLAAGYWIAMVRLGPRLAPNPLQPASRLQMSTYALGVFATWVASDWPVHMVAERSLFSVHMTQHLTFSMIATPLLVMGTPAWLARWLLSPAWLLATVRFCARFIPAVVIFNVLLAVTHWPAFVDATLQSGLVHFFAHVAIFGAALVGWLPVLSPLPEIPRFTPPIQMIYLFTQSVLPIIPASFLTFGARPLYGFYNGTQRVWGFSVLDDQRAAGLIMKIGAGLVLSAMVGVVFFRWAAEEEASSRTSVHRRSRSTIPDDLVLETESR